MSTPPACKSALAMAKIADAGETVVRESDMCFGHEGSVRKRWPCVFLGQKNEVMPASATDYQPSIDMDDGGIKEC